MSDAFFFATSAKDEDFCSKADTNKLLAEHLFLIALSICFKCVDKRHQR